MWLFLSFISGVAVFHGKLYFPVSAACVVICLLGLSLLKRGSAPKYFVILSAGFLYAWIRYEPIELNYKPPDELTVTGVFTSLPVKIDQQEFPRNTRFKICPNFDVVLEACVTLKYYKGADFSGREGCGRFHNLIE